MRKKEKGSDCILHNIAVSYPFHFNVVCAVYEITRSYDKTIDVLETACSENRGPVTIAFEEVDWMKEKMTKREAAERNVKAGGDERNGALICKECLLYSDCWNKFKHFQTNGYQRCVSFCKQWLDDHPVDGEWKELDIEKLPEGYMNKNPIYQMGFMDNSGEIEKTGSSPMWALKQILISIECGEDPCKYYYRKRCPEQKEPSHEELADDYLEKINLFVPSGYSYGDWANVYNQIRNAFIAGRKSVKTKPEN